MFSEHSKYCSRDYRALEHLRSWSMHGKHFYFTLNKTGKLKKKKKGKKNEEEREREAQETKIGHN